MSYRNELLYFGVFMGISTTKTNAEPMLYQVDRNLQVSTCTRSTGIYSRMAYLLYYCDSLIHIGIYVYGYLYTYT